MFVNNSDLTAKVKLAALTSAIPAEKMREYIIMFINTYL
jgi:hypothetical protein